MSATAVPLYCRERRVKPSGARFYRSFPGLIPSPFPAEKHLVLLRDGRTLIGFLRSIDQFGTLREGGRGATPGAEL